MEAGIMHLVRAILTVGLAVACGASHAVAPAPIPSGASAEQRVELSNFDFSPHDIHLRAGQAVSLVLANVASGGHDFSAPEFFAAARIDPADAAMIEDGEIEVPGKETRTVHLVPAAGTYRLTCTHTLHAAFGMKGTIVVD
jgi:plastocyanin